MKISTSNYLLHLLCLCFVSGLYLACSQPVRQESEIGLTLIPPGTITNQVDLDIRAGIKNSGTGSREIEVVFYLNEEQEEKELHRETIQLEAGGSQCVKFALNTHDKVGRHTIILKVKDGGVVYRKSKSVQVTSSDIRSTKAIDGAFVGFYHWSEEEGKMWNPDIKKMSDAQWQEMTSSMHKIGMDIVVIQESFRNQHYVGKHSIEQNGYQGKAFYPSQLYADRMPIAAQDPIEAILTQADQLGMHVFMGVGMYAWFDYSKGSLEWHKKVAQELWEMYGDHESFYGFYVSEEGMGSLDCFETDSLKQIVRRQEVLDFFREFKPFCNNLAPDKPVMFAPNGWGVGRAKELYPELLKNVDIICPFAFARMPKGDMKGKEAVDMLQSFCNAAQAHLWLDLEAFLFDEKEGYLVPRPIREIKHDLTLFDNFEKVICYQYPGVFNDPEMSVRIGEESTLQLFKDYREYLNELK